jgi:YfiH family protein
VTTAGSAGVLVPQWPAPANVRALCSTRTGGVSAPPYGSFNLGDHVGDDSQAVAANRARWAERLGTRPVFLKQVHGVHVAELGTGTADGSEADACIATSSDVACTIMVADCLPVLLTSASGEVVGAAHAGWRGLCGVDGLGVLESTWTAFWPKAGVAPEAVAAGTLAWLGPCIGPGAFEVGDEVKAAFARTQPQSERHFRPGAAGQWWADLPALARDRLQSLGITRIYGNDGTAPWCTVGDASRFFSHRRDRVSGRLAASIWRI